MLCRVLNYLFCRCRRFRSQSPNSFSNNRYSNIRLTLQRVPDGGARRPELKSRLARIARPEGGKLMSKFKNRLGLISAALLGVWLVAMTSHHLERLVELFPLMALVTGLVEVARKQQLAQRTGLRRIG